MQCARRSGPRASVTSLTRRAQRHPGEARRQPLPERLAFSSSACLGCGLGSAGGAPSRAFCCEIALLGPAPWPGAQDYRQRLYGAILQRRILAGTDLVFEQLRGPLMILLLQEQVFSVELWPVERGETRVGLSMLGVQVMCHRNTLDVRRFR